MGELDRVEQFMMRIISKLLLFFLVLMCTALVIGGLALLAIPIGIIGDATCLYPIFREDC